MDITPHLEELPNCDCWMCRIEEALKGVYEKCTEKESQALSAAIEHLRFTDETVDGNIAAAKAGEPIFIGAIQYVPAPTAEHSRN